MDEGALSVVEDVAIGDLAGERVWFERCYVDHRDRVVRALAMTLGDVELASDCFQEAIVRALAHRRAGGQWSNPAGWLYRVGLNHGRSRWRRLSREVLGTEADRPHAAGGGPDPAIATALRRLPVEQRAVVVLRYWLDWTVDDVAAALDVPAGTVKSRQHRALLALRESLEVSDAG